MLVGEDNIEEGLGKYVAGAALGLGLALGSPGKAMAQDVSKDDVNKPKIEKVLDKINKTEIAKKINFFLKGKTADTDSTQIKGPDADFEKLLNQVGEVKHLGNNRFEIKSMGTAGELSFAKSIALQSASQILAKELSKDDLFQGKLSNTNIVEERAFESNKDGSYTYFITVTTTLN